MIGDNLLDSEFAYYSAGGAGFNGEGSWAETMKTAAETNLNYIPISSSHPRTNLGDYFVLISKEERIFIRSYVPGAFKKGYFPCNLRVIELI